VAFFHHQNGFTDFGRLDRRPASRRAAADDNQIISTQLKIPSNIGLALWPRAKSDQMESFDRKSL
jgi:hypothetical protein